MSATDARPIALDRIAYAKRGNMTLFARKCKTCNSMGYARQNIHSFESAVHCETCNGDGWTNINAAMPTIAPPGSVEKSVVLQVRYSRGIEPWHPEDEKSMAADGDWHWLKPVGAGQDTHGHPHKAHDIFDSGSEW